MSFILHGVGVSDGIAIGRAHLASSAALNILHYQLPKDQIDAELARLHNAFSTVRLELETLKSSTVQGAGPAEFNAFLELHQMILDDPMFSQAALDIVKQAQCNAEWAITQQMEVLVARFEEIEDAYLRERKTDVAQIAERVLKVLLGHPGYTPPPVKQDGSGILVAHDLSPADVMQYKQYQFSAFLTDMGGPTSHTAIVARSLNIPSIVAMQHAQQLIRENDNLIVDGNQGIVIINPDKYILAEYRLKQNQLELEKRKLWRLRFVAAVTRDGTPVDLLANIELPQEVERAKEHGATGIGLFRSEFLFLNRDDLPDEEEQFEAYSTVIKGMNGSPVIIRTFDLGADKNLRSAYRMAPNPALGLRAIRMSLAEPGMFLAQLRAILRASSLGHTQILIPMLSSSREVDQTLQMIEFAKQSLRDENKPFNETIKIGCMVEIPATALSLELFMRKLDFLSIGTNDLIQYTLAIDRTDETVAHLFDPLHPAILRLLARIIQSATKAGIPVSICGEMAGDAKYTRLLLGMGLRQFSMYPTQLLTVKREVLDSSLPDISRLIQKILKADEPEKIHDLLQKLNS
ncbi:MULTISPECIES: phosphoenolpyruvate--protein phosphotransferase [Nitrosomonas]|uniref:Phosphoenolpyruvate-protein phosphotransferase n=2 Tax=Nitrosomonas eutropha TaxID=916 RepID=A0ABX5M849_9PROT|nr:MULTISPECIES: phosphoenolpyruvate--protein phosphotransferase [Nitrosomonas]ABI58804.1 phosphoenolpyruvate--protein phosphotransferase [Nitrosomonas eutropha C91]MXS79698.1 phosphoenolpyruvate--protein phosphotransferase [Nitrosomonas sp. GH22]PXV81150.1 phosphoenolpyruvate--protein phosphotransferase [Nitrosomonas eutropha]SDW25578.1 phosphoenolpyruvate--protein phosphotransferase [Nitrosomonas eutropha]SEI75806.1 phosphoenolpyruvate--protein phosphotransferase [Nitrosomonas eutropha]